MDLIVVISRWLCFKLKSNKHQKDFFFLVLCSVVRGKQALYTNKSCHIFYLFREMLKVKKLICFCAIEIQN